VLFLVMLKDCSIHAHVPFRKLNRYFDSIEKSNINVQLYISADDLDNTSTDQFAEWGSIFQGKGIKLTLHAPYMDISPGGVDRKIRRISLERMIQLMDTAKILNPGIITVHPGFDHWRNDNNLNQWLNNSSLFWKELLQYTEDLNFRFTVENVFEQTPETLLKLIENIASPRFGFCFDTGHFNLFSKSPLDEWFKRLGSYLFETHIHDNHGEKDSHLPIGEGSFPFTPYFELLSKILAKPVLTFETHSEKGVLESIKSFKKITGQEEC
tara:strand:- start:63 stop:866 length:804 start_codon:yes stop_codon:yes gene_type:complete